MGGTTSPMTLVQEKKREERGGGLQQGRGGALKDLSGWGMEKKKQGETVAREYYSD